jgi:PAS domain S-box-containing protein
VTGEHQPLDGPPLDGPPLDGPPLDGPPLDGPPLDDEIARTRRRRAEDRLRVNTAAPLDTERTPPLPEETARLLHELRVHQIELEMQNEELRGAQLQLEASRARWLDLYELAPVGFCTVNHLGLLVQANLTLATMLGTPRSALLRRPFSRFVFEDDQGLWFLLRKNLLADRSPQSCQLRMIAADRSYLSAQLTVTSAIDERGDLELRVAATDVTARQQAERESKTARAQLDAIIDSTPSHIFALDRAQRLTLVNAAMALHHGRSKADMLGCTVDDLYEPDSARAVRAVNARVLRTGDSESLEQQIVTMGATAPRVVLAAKAPLRDPDGVVIGLSGVLTDITEWRLAEVERASLSAQLQQAQKMESIGRLAGGVAHDFNNQLGVIIGHADFALSRLDASQPEHEEFTEIRNAALRSAELTRQLLSFARRQAIQPSVLALNATVAPALKMLGRLIGESIALVWQPGAELWPVTMDAAQIDQILANLAVNARDAIAGYGTITVATNNCVRDEAWCASRADAVAGEYVCLTVADSGSGIDAEALAKIFEPFYTTKETGKGTGLGLASVYGAVRQNGGFITVASEVGQGTTFAIYLPRSTQPPEPPTASVASSPRARGAETILLVEDEAAVRRLTVKALAAHGYTVLAADGPQQAIQLAQEHGDAIALLLSDVVMPGMGGVALTEMLVASHPHLRHLFTSGYAMQDGEAVETAQAANFLAKPFTLAALTDKVREVLDRV